MGSIADSTALVAQTLSLSRREATSSIRLQVDKQLYKLASAQLLLTHNVQIIEDIVTQIERYPELIEIKLEKLGVIKTKVLVLTVGTFIRSVCHIGGCSLALDRLNHKSNDCVYNLLKTHGASLKRLKTGTSPRLEKSSIQWSNIIKDKSNAIKYGFSKALNTATLSMCCRWLYTNNGVYTTIINNLSKTPLRLGRLLSRGPKYCLSIEDKLLKFGRKPQKLIIEPEAIGANSVYANGLSTSMPMEIQLLILKSIYALSNTKAVIAGYTLEYDSLCSNNLSQTLESVKIHNVYTAGQINGTTGYEEASVQGFVAGLNAARRVLSKREYVFNRKFSYIGVLINDITHSVLSDPYRVLTTRAKNRTQLKQRNAVLRLLPCSLSINALNRYKEYKQVYWASVNKSLKLKYLNAVDKNLFSGKVLELINKFRELRDSVWHKLITQQWGN